MLVAVPDAILIPLLWLCITISLTVMLRAFTPWLVVPVVVVASALTWRWRPTAYLARFGWQSSLIALLGAVAWVGVNAPFASRWVSVTRDPGFLTLEGIWLTHHSAPSMSASAAAKIAAAIPGAQAAGSGYQYADGVLYVQGAKLVPGLAAIGGWVGGTDGVLIANLVIGALALLTLYGFARRVVGPIWSLVVVGGLAISMPFVAFTRSIYTEPIVVAVTFGGLTLLWVAYRSRRWTGFVTGGALLGAGGLARIDGAAIVVGVVAGLMLAAAGTTTAARRSELRTSLLLASGSALVVTGLGLTELMVDSPGYTSDLASQWHELVAAVVAIFVIAVLVTLGRPWRWLTVWITRRARVIGVILVGVVVVVGAALVTRPLWYEGHHLAAGSAYSNLAVTLAVDQGIPTSPTRSWDEQSLTWVAMYYSWIVVGAALLGIAFALRRALLTRDPRLLVAIAVIAAPSLLYLWAISITPDQIWAMRRFLPVTLPGFLLFAAWFFRLVMAWLLRRSNPIRATAAVVAAVVAAVGFAFPAYTWKQSNLFTAVQYGGQLGQMEGVCTLLDGRPAVLVGSGSTSNLPTLRTLCGVNAVAVPGKMTAAQLSAARTAFGSQKPVVITYDPTSVAWEGGKSPAPYSSTVITSWQNVLNERPSQPVRPDVGIWAGTITVGGELAPITGD